MMREDGTGKMLWGMAVIAAAYWCSGCVRQVYVMGVSAYVKERVLLVRYGKQIPGWCSKAIKKVQKGIEKVYRSFDNIDFTDRNNRNNIENRADQCVDSDGNYRIVVLWNCSSCDLFDHIILHFA